MALYEIYNAVTADLTTRVAGLTSHLGEEYLRLEEAPPRVIWVPRGTDSYTSSVGQGGDGVTNPRPLWTCNENLEIHLWAANVDANGQESFPGANLAACENLRQQFIRSVHGLTWGSYQLRTGQWASPGMGAQIRFGTLYILSLQIQVPMTRDTDLETELVSFNPTTYQMTFPDGTTETGAVTP